MSRGRIPNVGILPLKSGYSEFFTTERALDTPISAALCYHEERRKGSRT